MDGVKKLDLSGKVNDDPPTATYKPISETDIEGGARCKEADGADEKMLPKDKVVLNSCIDHSDVKVSLNEKQNGDAKLEIGETKNFFGGMDKEELMKYANDPFWVRLRWFLFIVFWLLWAAMLIGAIMIIYAAPKCNPPPPRTWWEQGPLTVIEGNTNFEALKSLDKNIKGVIVNWEEDAYSDIDESHDIIKIIKQANELDMKVIIELDPATSSVWFENSENKNDTLNDYYLWRPPRSFTNGGPVEPNNWLNVNNEPAWKYSTKRKEFYYCPLDKPHLNFRNENVTNAFSSVISKFLGYGASGIRIKNAPLLLVDSKFEDETTIGNNPAYDHKQYGFYAHTRTENLPDLGTLLKQWRTVVRNKTVDGPFMIKEELSNPDVYRVNKTLVVDLPLKEHIFSKANITASELVNNLNHTFNIDNIAWPLWKVNSTAFPKDVLDMVTYLLPGVPLINASDVIDTHLLKMRRSPSIMRGNYSIHSINNDTVFSYISVTPGNPGILVALNVQNEKVVVNFPKEIPALDTLTEVTIQLFSSNFKETEFMNINAKKDATAVPISPRSVIILSYVPKKKN